MLSRVFHDHGPCSLFNLQHEANEKLLKQAEEHRALTQKQFTESMARMQAEQEKTIKEAVRIRDEYAKSAKMAQVSYDSMMDKVESNQSTNVLWSISNWRFY
jgi:hypothetical protein